MIKKFRLKDVPGEEEAAFFAAEGYLYVENFYDVERDIEPIREDIYRLIGIVAAQRGISIGARAYSSSDFDHGLQQLIASDRPSVGLVYDAVKKLPSYIRVACHERHEVYGRVLLGSPFIGFSPRGYGIRMDNPMEDEYSTQPHQDYVSQLSSQNAVVTWGPLRDVTPELGPMRVYPRSHKAGVFPIENKGGGSRGLVIAKVDEVLSGFESILPLVESGDCLFLHFLTLHESGRNRSEKTRWSMLSRYFDFCHPSGVAIQWRGGLQEGNSFEKVHPELLVRETEG
jgi:hypothetical protein